MSQTRASEPGEGPHGRVTREQIVTAALALADAEGFDAVSMRKVAARLGLGTMTLYHYVASKDALVYLMADAIAGEMLLPDEVPASWREALRAIAGRTRDTFLRHPWLVETAGRRPLATPNLLRHVEQSIAAVAGLGLDRETATAMLSATDDYTIGFAVRQVVQSPARTGGDRSLELSAELQSFVGSGELPLLARAIEEAPALPLPEARFDIGLEWLLDGIEAMLAQRGEVGGRGGRASRSA